MAKRHRKINSLVPGKIPHRFRFSFQVPGLETKQEYKIDAQNYFPKNGATIWLHPEHVEQAIAAGGIGDTMRCSGAFCSRDDRTRQVLINSNVIPENIANSDEWGTVIEFSDSRLTISFGNAKNGFPNECLTLAHDGKYVALINDKGLAGQKRLLAELKENGPIPIHLLPVRTSDIRDRSKESKRPREKKSPGEKVISKGSKRRIARIPMSAVGAA